MVLEKTLESPLDCKEIQPVHSDKNLPCNAKDTGLIPGPGRSPVPCCSSSHGYFVTELGFKPVVYQSEPCVLSHLCHVGSSMKSVAPFGIKIGL